MRGLTQSPCRSVGCWFYSVWLGGWVVGCPVTPPFPFLGWLADVVGLGRLLHCTQSPTHPFTLAQAEPPAQSLQDAAATACAASPAAPAGLARHAARVGAELPVSPRAAAAAGPGPGAGAALQASPRKDGGVGTQSRPASDARQQQQQQQQVVARGLGRTVAGAAGKQQQAAVGTATPPADAVDLVYDAPTRSRTARAGAAPEGGSTGSKAAAAPAVPRPAAVPPAAMPVPSALVVPPLAAPAAMPPPAAVQPFAAPAPPQQQDQACAERAEPRPQAGAAWVAGAMPGPATSLGSAGLGGDREAPSQAQSCAAPLPKPQADCLRAASSTAAAGGGGPAAPSRAARPIGRGRVPGQPTPSQLGGSTASAAAAAASQLHAIGGLPACGPAGMTGPQARQDGGAGLPPLAPAAVPTRNSRGSRASGGNGGGAMAAMGQYEGSQNSADAAHSIVEVRRRSSARDVPSALGGGAARHRARQPSSVQDVEGEGRWRGRGALHTSRCRPSHPACAHTP